MTVRTITLTLPDALYEQVSQRAANANRSLEAVLLEEIALFDPLAGDTDLEMALSALKVYDDDTLWKIAEYRIPFPQRQRRRELVSKLALAADEQAELDALVDLYDRFVAFRSEALVLLKQRGYDIETYLQESA